MKTMILIGTWLLPLPTWFKILTAIVIICEAVGECAK